MNDEELTVFRRRAAEAREIAKGVYDKEERRVVLEFVDDSEKLAETARKSRQSR